MYFIHIKAYCACSNLFMHFKNVCVELCCEIYYVECGVYFVCFFLSEKTFKQICIYMHPASKNVVDVLPKTQIVSVSFSFLSLEILIPFWLIIMWDCTALKMHLTKKMYMICTWDWQQNLTYVWYVAPSTHKSALTCCYAPPTIYWLKGTRSLTSVYKVEHFSPCDRSDDISISRSEAPPTYWLSVKVSSMERWREMKSLLHSDQFS